MNHIKDSALKYTLPTRYDELTIKVTVRTNNPVKIRLIVCDNDMDKTVFTNRYKTVNGQFTFDVRMPVSGQTAAIWVYNDDTTNYDNPDDSFEVVKISSDILEKKMDVIDMGNSYVRSFIDFATRICYNAGTLSSGVYVSGDKKFTIEYLPILTDENGMEVTTPARIDISNGVIQVSQRQFRELTVPNRMAILLHEFSHFYVNDNVDDEVEADLNGLLIYLGLGYPRIEALEVFGKTFEGAPNESNKIRYDTIKNFIDHFDESKSYFFS